MQAQLTRYFADLSDDPLSGAFTARRAVMPFRGRQRVEPERVASRWAEAMATPADAAAERLAYVHIPFCANHCLFCGFYRNAYTPAAAGDYVDQVIRDLEREAQSPAVRASAVTAVYLGGGTPSALTADELARLLAALRRHLPLAADCEITVEGRIIHFDAEKIDACLEAGANRFSIGVQSFDTEVRRRQGRRSSREEAVRFLEGLKERAAAAALVIDLMYGLPGQTMEVWRADLATAAALAPDGIDLYGLNIIPGTPLYTALEAGKFATAPTLADLGAYYRAGSEAMAALSWRQVSNNHWARTPLERNRYNRLIKEGVDCLAYGSGAGGSIGAVSYGLTGDLAAFGEAVAAGRKPIGMMMASDGLRELRNQITGSLEMGRFDPALFARFTGRDLSGGLRPLFDQWHAAGLVDFADSGVRLTTAGRFWYANLVAALHDIAEAEFLPPRPAADAIPARRTNA